MTDLPVHSEIAPLAWLLGTWVGEGEGWYPTITPFAYGEEIVLSHVGKPFLAYRQRTWSIPEGRPLHAETGFWRAVGPDREGWRVELVLAHASGVIEIEQGRATSSGENHVVDMISTAVICTPTAKEVTSLARHVSGTGDALEYELSMGAVGVGTQPHLRAHLTRSG